MTPWLLTIGVGSNLAALAVNVVILREARRDLAAVIEAGVGNGRRLIAEASVRQEWARLAVVVLLIVAGAAAAVEVATAVDPPRGMAAPFSVASRLGYALSGVGLAADGILAYRHRRRILEAHMQRHDEEIDR